MKKKQRRILDVLKSKGYDVEEVDIAASGTSNKEKMRRLCKDQTALPPQICKGEEYIGVGLFFLNLCLWLCLCLHPCPAALFHLYSVSIPLSLSLSCLYLYIILYLYPYPSQSLSLTLSLSLSLYISSSAFTSVIVAVFVFVSLKSFSIFISLFNFLFLFVFMFVFVCAYFFYIKITLWWLETFMQESLKVFTFSSLPAGSAKACFKRSHVPLAIRKETAVLWYVTCIQAANNPLWMGCCLERCL